MNTPWVSGSVQFQGSVLGGGSDCTWTGSSPCTSTSELLYSEWGRADLPILLTQGKCRWSVWLFEFDFDNLGNTFCCPWISVIIKNQNQKVGLVVVKYRVVLY